MSASDSGALADAIAAHEGQSLGEAAGLSTAATDGSRLRRVWRAAGPIAAARFAAYLAIDAVRDFVWSDIRHGLLDLRGLGSPLRALVWLGFGALLLVVAAILEGDWWRQAFPLVPLTQGIPGRGRLVPTALVPATYLLLSLAWSFILAGALRARRLIKFGVLSLWIMTMAGSLVSVGVGGVLSSGTALATLIAVPLAFVVFSVTRPRRVVEFLVILSLVAANNAVNQIQGVQTWQTSGAPLMVMRLNFEMFGLGMLVLPLLLLVGMEVAAFANKAAGWTADIVEQRVGRWATWLLLAGLLAWRLWTLVDEAVGWLSDGPLGVQIAALAGGLLVPSLVGLAWLAVRALAPPAQRLADRDEIEGTAKRLALPLIAAYTVTTVIVVSLSGLALALTVAALAWPALFAAQEHVMALLNRVGDADAQWAWHIVVSGVALAVAVVLARRGRVTSALFLTTLGLLDLLRRLMADGRPLHFLNAAGAGDRADVWWVLLFAILACWWLLRRQLTPRRASALAYLILVTLLLRQTDFIANRFSPFVESAGVGFVAFGILWDALTIGAWANVGTPSLPRVSRIFLYLGYVLMTVTVINWAVAAHDLQAIGQMTGDLALLGLGAFGKPMLYTMFVATLIAVTRGRPGDAGGPTSAARSFDDGEPTEQFSQSRA